MWESFPLGPPPENENMDISGWFKDDLLVTFLQKKSFFFSEQNHSSNLLDVNKGSKDLTILWWQSEEFVSTIKTLLPHLSNCLF